MKRTCLSTKGSGSGEIEEIWCGYKNVKHSTTIKNIDEVQNEKIEMIKKTLSVNLCVEMEYAQERITNKKVEILKNNTDMI